MPQKENKEKKARSVLETGISPVSRIMLFIGIFLIVGIPLLLIFPQQLTRQAELNYQYSILEKALGNQESPEVLKKRTEGDIRIAKEQIDNGKAVFPSPDQIPEITDRLLQLAKLNDIELTKMQVGTVKSSIGIGSDKLEYPVVVFDINLRGLMPKFQNFLLALNSKFPTSEVKTLSFKLPEVEEEMDTANMVLNIYSNKVRERTGGEISIDGKKPLATFADRKDITTDSFKVKGTKWRIDWKVTATDANWAGLTMLVYRKGETMRYADVFYHVGGSLEGTDYVYDLEGDFYLKVITGNITGWDIKIYE